MTQALPVIANQARCTGHCCRNFPLPISLEELRERQAQPEPPPDVIVAKPRVKDGDILIDMLIPLGTGTYSDGTASFLFTCKHLDVDTGDCRIYENRPRMCSDYPYGSPCPIEECTAANRGVSHEVP